MIDLEKRDIQDILDDMVDGFLDSTSATNEEYAQAQSLVSQAFCLGIDRKQAEITELKQQIEGLKELNIELQYSKQRVRVELSDLDAEFILIKQKLEKLESGEFVLMPKLPNAKILKSLSDLYSYCLPDDAIEEANDVYKAVIEAVEKDHE